MLRGDFMDYKREAEERLINYENLKVSLENLEDRIKELKADLSCVKGISYSDMPKGSRKDLPDDAVINKMYELQVARNNYSQTKRELSKIDNLLNNLPDYERKIIKAYYIDGLRGESLLKETRCGNERQFYRDKKGAIKTLAIQMFGIKVIS